MNNRIVILFFLSAMGTTDTSQTQTMEIALRRETGSGPFGRLIVPATRSWSTDYSGVPGGLDTFLIMSTTFCAKSEMLILSGIKKNDKIIIFDKNGNRNFSDDIVWSFSMTDTVDTGDLEPISIRLNCGRGKPDYVMVKPDPYGGYYASYPDSLEKILDLGIQLCEYRLGQVKTSDSSDFPIGVFAGYPGPVFRKNNVQIAMLNEVSEPSEIVSQNPFYRIGDIVYFENAGYKLDSITPYGDTLFLTFTGVYTDGKIGYNPGFFSPDFSVQDMKGEHISLSAYRGSYVLLDFWGTWCVPCIRLMPGVRKLAQRYSGKLRIVAIALDKSQEDVERFLQKNEMAGVFIYENLHSQSDVSLKKQFNVLLLPTYILIDPEGKIVIRGTWENTLTEMATILAEGK